MIAGGLGLFSIVAAIGACVLKLYGILLLFSITGILFLLLSQKRDRDRRFTIEFEENQPYEARLFIAEVLVSYRTPLSQFFHESKATDIETKMAETVDKLIERYKFPREDELRSVLIRGCLMNVDYVTWRTLLHGPHSRHLLDIFFAHSFTGLSMYLGDSLWMALSLAILFTILLVIVRCKVIWPEAWRATRKEAKDQVDRSMLKDRPN
jgi:hypothetical protein